MIRCSEEDRRGSRRWSRVDRCVGREGHPLRDRGPELAWSSFEGFRRGGEGAEIHTRRGDRVAKGDFVILAEKFFQPPFLVVVDRSAPIGSGFVYLPLARKV